MAGKLKVYVETSFVCYHQESGYRCPWIMTPKTFLDNKNMEVPNA